MANDATRPGVPVGESHLHPDRVRGRARVARALRATAEHFTAKRGRAVVPQWAARAGVSRQQIERWCSEVQVTGAVGGGDLEALLAPDEREYFDARLADERARDGARPPSVPPATDPRFIALAAAQRAGDMAKQARRHMADGRCDALEWAEIEQECAEGEAEMRTAKLAARAAREQAR